MRVSTELRREHVGDLGETAGLGERDPRLQELLCGDGAVDRRERIREVVVQEGDLASLPGLGGERDRLPVVVEAAPVAEVATGHGAVAEGAGRPGQAELLRQGERPLGVAEASLVPSL